MTALPPRRKPDNESAGWLGYYCETHLPITFDLVDIDGTVPVVWCYRKAETTCFRFIEEKPGTQRLHPSQDRTFRALLNHVRHSSLYVIYEADRLREPTFPIDIVRLGRTTAHDQTRRFTRPDFDTWMTDGLVTLPPTRNESCDTWENLLTLTEAPFTPPPDLPDGCDWQAIDKALTTLAVAMTTPNPT